MTATVSVIIPVYRTPVHLLKRCLKSAACQTGVNVEIIVVDDASPDNCPEILDDFAVHNEQVRVIHRLANGRAGMARNDGLDSARGDFVFFADADDFIRPDLCKTLTALAQVHDADIVACSWSEVTEAGQVTHVHHLPNRLFELTCKRDQAHCFRTLTYALWNKLFRREALASLRFEQFEANIGEDILFNVAALCRSRRMITTSHVGYDYTVDHESASHCKAKGFPYMETIARSQERISQVLKETLGAQGRMHADWLALKRYTTGFEWTANNPDMVEQQALRQYWREYFVRKLWPELTNHYTIARIFYLLGLLENINLAARFMRLTVRVYDRLLSLLILKKPGRRLCK